MTYRCGNFKPQAHRIYTDTGRTAGFVSGPFFEKRIDSLKHVFRKPYKRIAFDVATLERALAVGATHVRISFFDKPDVLTAPIAPILSKGKPEKGYGFGKQISWPYAMFENESEPKPEPKAQQPSLFATEVAR